MPDQAKSESESLNLSTLACNKPMMKKVAADVLCESVPTKDPIKALLIELLVKRETNLLKLLPVNDLVASPKKLNPVKNKPSPAKAITILFMF